MWLFPKQKVHVSKFTFEIDVYKLYSSISLPVRYEGGVSFEGLNCFPAMLFSWKVISSLKMTSLTNHHSLHLISLFEYIPNTWPIL